MKEKLRWILFLLIFGSFLMSTSGCLTIYNPKKNKKEQQKIRKNESSKKDRVINRGL